MDRDRGIGRPGTRRDRGRRIRRGRVRRTGRRGGRETRIRRRWRARGAGVPGGCGRRRGLDGWCRGRGSRRRGRRRWGGRGPTDVHDVDPRGPRSALHHDHAVPGGREDGVEVGRAGDRGGRRDVDRGRDPAGVGTHRADLVDAAGEDLDRAVLTAAHHRDVRCGHVDGSGHRPISLARAVGEEAAAVEQTRAHGDRDDQEPSDRRQRQDPGVAPRSARAPCALRLERGGRPRPEIPGRLRCGETHRAE
jgi:hypothetical protein